MNRPTKIKAFILSLAAGGMLAACAGGASEGEFVQACLTGPGQQGTEEMCKCAASAAKASLSPKLYHAMVLDMQGKKQEAEALVADMTFEQRADFGMKQFEVIGKCMIEK